MPRGRPTKYKPEFCEQAEVLCNLGATDFDIARSFKIDRATFYRWKSQHEEFCDSIKTGKQSADERVERSLYERAVGYSFNSEKIFHYQGQITRAACIEHVPPDTGAAAFWLKNRRGWRDKQEITGADGGPVQLEWLPPHDNSDET